MGALAPATISDTRNEYSAYFRKKKRLLAGFNAKRPGRSAMVMGFPRLWMGAFVEGRPRPGSIRLLATAARALRRVEMDQCRPASFVLCDQGGDPVAEVVGIGLA